MRDRFNGVLGRLKKKRMEASIDGPTNSKKLHRLQRSDKKWWRQGNLLQVIKEE